MLKTSNNLNRELINAERRDIYHKKISWETKNQDGENEFNLLGITHSNLLNPEQNLIKQ